MTRLLTLLFSLSVIPTLEAAKPLPLSSSYWKSSSFLKEFNGSYRINASIEPSLTSAERGLLVEMQSLMSKGQRTQTITKLKASSLLNTSAAIQFNLANVLSENGKLEEAISYYKKAVASQPSFRRAHQNLAYAYHRNNQAEDAYKHLLEVVRLGGNEGSVRGLLGYSFLEKEQYEPALQSFREALIIQPDTRDWKLGIAQTLQQLDRNAEALPIYEDLLKQFPDDHDIQLHLALIYHDSNQTEKAVTLLEILRRKEALSDEYTLLLATLLIENENVVIGGEQLKATISKEDFNQPEAALNSIQYCLGKDLDALSLELHGLIQQNSLTPGELIRHQRIHAQILLKREPNNQEGLTILKKLITGNPTDSHSLHLLGQQLVLAKDSYQALLIFDQAIHADGPYSLPARLDKAQTLVHLSDYENAIKELESYLQASPHDTKISEYLEAVQNLYAAKRAGS